MPSKEKNTTFCCSLPSQYTGKDNRVSPLTILLFYHYVSDLCDHYPELSEGEAIFHRLNESIVNGKSVEQSRNRQIATHSLRSVLVTSKVRWSRNDRFLNLPKEKYSKGLVITYKEF
jgi:hypothetical protein